MEAANFNHLHQPRKRIFIGLLTVSLLMIVGSMGLVWFISINRLGIYQKALLIAVIAGIVVFLALVALGISGIILTLWKARTFPVLQNFMRVAINLLFPVAISLGKMFGIDRDLIQSSFIEVNNQLVLSRGLKVWPEQILLLAPHCLQEYDCPHKITVDISNCQKCGGCSIHQLRNIQEEYGINLAIAAGGTLARKAVHLYRPKAIVAIACERDLTSGILDSNPLPVFGVLNERPNGPCINTKIEMVKVKEAINNFVGGH